jgi:tetrapyrrole methylase family protein/MazG family protein
VTPGRIVVVGLGPAGPDLVSPAAQRALARIEHRFVRTWRHPASVVVAGATSFDHLYESAASREEVYAGIAEALVAAALGNDEVAYAVPGSPLVLERSVALLRADPRVEVEVVPGLSFLDLAWHRLLLDPVSAGVRLVDGEEFAVQAAGERGPLLVAHCWSRQVLSGMKLAVEEEPASQVTILARLGCPDEKVFEVPWAELDREVDPDHLTTVFVPDLSPPVAADLMGLVELVRTLRRRCPWDREQTHESLTRHLVEEAYEVVEAIESLAAGPEGYAALEEELGDLLVQVLFHATLAAEEGQFNLADVARGVHDKLVGRHPHVFGSVEETSAERVMANWERIKQAEKGRASVMEGIPPALPALAAAAKVAGKARSTGVDRRDQLQVLGGLQRAVEELVARPGEGPVGTSLLALAEVAQRLGADPESALRRAVAGYRRRFALLEELAAARGVDLAHLGDAEVATLWVED